MNKLKILSNSLMILFLAAMLVLPASAALRGVSPVNSAANGFPLWYQELNGTALQLCLDQNGLCVLPPTENLGVGGAVTFNPNQTIAFPANFPSESFYAFAESKMDVGLNISKATMRIILESSFTPDLANNGNATPRLGQQITFLRVNFQLETRDGVLAPNSTYKAFHPFGDFTFNTSATGDPAASFPGGHIRLQDGGAVALDFTTLIPATTTNISSFLKWDAGAPAGFIGDGVTPHAITGSPLGNNTFRITGPNVTLNGLGDSIEQPLFTVAGKMFTANITGFKINDTNGNGVVDAGEPGIPGWNITLRNATTGVPITSVLTTGATGAYSFLNLNPGTYNVTEEIKAGFNATNATFKVIDLVQDVINQNFTNQNVTAGNVTSNLTTITVTPATITLSAGVTTTFTATATNQTGAPMPNITITWSSSNTTVGTVTPLTAITNASGMANTTFNATVNGTAMVNATNLTVKGTAIAIVGTATTGALTNITITPANAPLAPGGIQIFTATARDLNGIPLQGINITWTSSNATIGSVAPLNAITNVNGIATTTFTAGTVNGTVMVNGTNATVKGTAAVTVTATSLLADIVGLGFGAGNGTGTKGGFINVTVNVFNNDIITTTYVVVVSGVAADGSSLVGTGTVMVAPGQTIPNVPIFVTIPTVKPAGSYSLFATLYRIAPIAEFPTTPLITRGLPTNATIV